MTTTKRDLAIFEGLSVVTIEGFDQKMERVDGVLVPEHGDMVDPPGTANFLCDQYGMQHDDFAADEPGILWSDYDGEGWSFSVLIATDEVDALKVKAEEAGYTVERVEPVIEPTAFGDGNGTVEILKHREGWVIAR